MNRFEKLAAINCNGKTEQKNGLTYLSWSWAWDQFKRIYPDSYYTVYEAQNGCLYHTDGRTAWVKTGVTLVDGDFNLENIEYLPIMGNRANRSLPLDQITSYDANTAIQRSLTKAIARHGLGLYIYAGEDLPEDEKQVQAEAKPEVKREPIFCEVCGTPIQDVAKRNGEIWKAEDIASYTAQRYGHSMCSDCVKKKAKGDG